MRARVASYKKQQDDTLVENAQQLMEISGQVGLPVKVCLLAGLTESEAMYCYNQEICNNHCCSCHKLHLINKQNGMTIVVMNWAREHGRRCYFALLPTLLWERFREITAFNEADIRAASKITKEVAGIELSGVCKIFYATVHRTMDSGQIDILVGKSKPSVARCCLLFGLDELISNYVSAWQAVGIILPVL